MRLGAGACRSGRLRPSDSDGSRMRATSSLRLGWPARVAPLERRADMGEVSNAGGRVARATKVRLDTGAIGERFAMNPEWLCLRFAGESLGGEDCAHGHVTEQARRPRPSGHAHEKGETGLAALELERELDVDERVFERATQPGDRAVEIAHTDRGGCLHQLPRKHFAGEALEQAAGAVAEALIEREERVFALVERNGVEGRRRAQPIQREMRPDAGRRSCSEGREGARTELTVGGFEQVSEKPGSKPGNGGHSRLGVLDEASWVAKSSFMDSRPSGPPARARVYPSAPRMSRTTSLVSSMPTLKPDQRRIDADRGELLVGELEITHDCGLLDQCFHTAERRGNFGHTATVDDPRRR